MKKSIPIIALLTLVSCAYFKYPHWDEVQIVPSVYNKPCVFKAEQVNECAATDWFKKRATVYKANTVVLVPSMHTAINNVANCLAGYFMCDAGAPPLKYNNNDYLSYFKPSKNTITGQAFLRKQNGDIVTCAGEEVLMYPNTNYFNQLYSIRSEYTKHSRSSDVEALVKSTKCDAQSNFEFDEIPAGEWVIKTQINWDAFWTDFVYSPPIVLHGHYIPSNMYLYTRHEPQGGVVMLGVTVVDGGRNRFIISE